MRTVILLPPYTGLAINSYIEFLFAFRSIGCSRLPVKATGGGERHTIYHARVVGLSEDAARDACHRLAGEHHACKVADLGST